MKSFIFFNFFLISASFAELNEIQKLKDGAGVYRNCYHCHSLNPGVNLTGPSLAGIWNQPAGQNKTYKLYSEALKKSGITWNEDNLKDWIQSPHTKVPGTTMTFGGISNKESVDDLLAFLKVALVPEATKKLLTDGITDQETISGQLPKNVSLLKSDSLIQNIMFCDGIYKVTTKDKKTLKHWEYNLSFKIDSSITGPQKNKPALISSGSMGDRFTVVFHDLFEIRKFVKGCN